MVRMDEREREAVGHADGNLYMVLGTVERPELVEVLSRRSVAHGGRAWAVDDVAPPARHRLYRADTDQHWVLDDRDERVPFSPG